MIRNSVIAFVLFILMDIVWLGFVAKGFYAEKMGDLVTFKDGQMQINYGAGAIVYVLMSLGLVYFVLPAVESQSLGRAFATGAGYGLLVYGVYDMTNMATLKTWPISLAAMDMAWGSFMCAAVTSCLVLIQVWIK